MRGFTPDDLTIIRRFVSVLKDKGVRTILSLRAAERGGEHNGELWARSMHVALDDVLAACDYSDGIVKSPQNVVNAAPSLVLIVGFTKHSSLMEHFVFPGGCVPSDGLVQTCLDYFFDSARERAIQD